MTINRLYNLSMNRLTASEKSWLENRVHDSRPEVAELAKDIYAMHLDYFKLCHFLNSLTSP